MLVLLDILEAIHTRCLLSPYLLVTKTCTMRFANFGDLPQPIIRRIRILRPQLRHLVISALR